MTTVEQVDLETIAWREGYADAEALQANRPDIVAELGQMADVLADVTVED